MLTKTGRHKKKLDEACSGLRQSRFLLLSLLGTALYLYINLFTFHNIPFLLLGDQTFFWEYAFRMLQGDHVYRDFFQFTPPGTDLFYLALLKLFGPSLWVVNFGLILLGMGLFAACFSVAQRILTRTQALFTAAIVMVLIFGERLDGTHHWFSLTLSLCAVRVIMPHRSSLRIISAGALTGVAAFFTQTGGAAALIALLFALLWEHSAYGKSWRVTLKNITLLMTAFGLVWFALNAHFIVSVGWQRFFFLQVIYPQRYIVESHGFIVRNLRNMLHLHLLPRLLRQFFVYLLLAIYPPVLWLCWRRRRDPGSASDMQIVPLAMLGLLLMLEIITRANWVRIYCVAPPALILLSWTIVHFTGTSLRRFVTNTAGCAIVCLAVIQTLGRQHSKYTVTELPAGKVALAAMEFEEYTWIKQHVKPGDYFYQGNWLDVYLPLALRNGVFAEELFPSERTRPEMVTLAVQQLEQRQIKYIMWSPQWSDSNHAETPSSDHLEPFRSYLRSHYTRVHIFSNQDEIWQRLQPEV